MKQPTVQRKARTSPGISKKNKEMVRLYASDPNMTKTEAYKRTHNIGPDTKLTSIYQQAAHTFNNPIVKTELAKYNDRVEEVLTNTVDHFGDSEKVAERSLAVDTAKYIHDKIHGKAVQRSEVRTEGVSLTIDLTSALGVEDAPTEA